MTAFWALAKKDLRWALRQPALMGVALVLLALELFAEIMGGTESFHPVHWSGDTRDTWAHGWFAVRIFSAAIVAPGIACALAIEERNRLRATLTHLPIRPRIWILEKVGVTMILSVLVTCLEWPLWLRVFFGSATTTEKWVHIAYLTVLGTPLTAMAFATIGLLIGLVIPNRLGASIATVVATAFCVRYYMETVPPNPWNILDGTGRMVLIVGGGLLAGVFACRLAVKAFAEAGTLYYLDYDKIRFRFRLDNLRAFLLGDRRAVAIQTGLWAALLSVPLLLLSAGLPGRLTVREVPDAVLFLVIIVAWLMPLVVVFRAPVDLWRAKDYLIDYTAIHPYRVIAGSLWYTVGSGLATVFVIGALFWAAAKNGSQSTSPLSFHTARALGTVVWVALFSIGVAANLRRPFLALLIIYGAMAAPYELLFFFKHGWQAEESAVAMLSSVCLAFQIAVPPLVFLAAMRRFGGQRKLARL